MQKDFVSKIRNFGSHVLFAVASFGHFPKFKSVQKKAYALGIQTKQQTSTILPKMKERQNLQVVILLKLFTGNFKQKKIHLMFNEKNHLLNFI